MQIEKTSSGKVVLLKITGSIAFTDVSTLRTNLQRLMKTGKRNIVVDCSEMKSINSHALATFLMVYKEIKDGTVAFANANQHVERVLHSTHLDDMFPLYGSVDEAVTAASA